MKTAYRVGDVVEIINGGCPIQREILEVRPTGYTWRYPDITGQTFLSENSSDPFFELRWKLAKAETA